MKRLSMLLLAALTLFRVLPLTANDQFDQGMSLGNQSKGQGSNAISGFKPEDAIPGYTSSPPEGGYYGGVTSSSVDLTGPGTSAMTTSEAGKTITESILNTPADSKPSLDAPFIAEGLAMKDKAETITGGGFDGCVDQPASFTEITTHQCLRDTKVEQYCTRTANIVVEAIDDPSNITRTYAFRTQPYHETNGVYYVDIVPDVTGELLGVAYSYQGTGRSAYVDIYGMGGHFVYQLSGSAEKVPLEVSVDHVERGQTYTFHHSKWATGSGTTMFTIPAPIILMFTIRVNNKIHQPKIEWTEHCPFSKEEGALTSTECLEPDEERTVIVDGKPYSLYQACWVWKDIYLTQAETEGTCGEYLRDAACTVSSARCADEVEGFCIRQQVTYSCERKTEGNGKICGGEFFCKDGSCAQAQTGTSNMFGQAVSSLAAVAAAGKDVAALNGENVRAFTGEGKSCKKFAAGFNNCCKDAGWGQDVGLSSCSSDEKALGKAKEKKLTIYVGEYCSKKVLGVCLEKKRGYCVFESKLARIVQEQGRGGQLGIGFGSGSSPDCRGITVDELTGLDFRAVDFSDFYSDLNAGSDIPEDQALLKKAQDLIAEKIAEAMP